MSKPLCIRVNQRDDSNITFEVDVQGGKPLLESMENAGVETHYHCRNGFCGACRTRLVAGQVNYTTEPLAYVRQGDILPCVCIAVTDLELEH